MSNGENTPQPIDAGGCTPPVFAASAHGYDEWAKSPYTQTLMKSIEQDYVPRDTTPQPQGDASPNADEALGRRVRAMWDQAVREEWSNKAVVGRLWEYMEGDKPEGATPQVSGGGELEAALLRMHASLPGRMADYQSARTIEPAHSRAMHDRFEELRAAVRAALSTPQARPDGGEAMVRLELNGLSMSGLVWTEAGRKADLRDGTKFYTHPAPAPDVALPLVDVLRIPAQPGLDPVVAYFEDYSPGQGRITVACYGDAWTASWGAMGDRTVRAFVAAVDPGYLSGAFLQLSGGNGRTRDYTDRIARAVIDALTAQGAG